MAYYIKYLPKKEETEEWNFKPKIIYPHTCFHHFV